MGITLTSKTVSSTYDSLLKLSDNDQLTGAFKLITDGLGTDTGISINDSGDVNISGTLVVGERVNTPILQLTGGTGTQGTFSWNTDEWTVDLIQNGTTLQLGQEVQIHVKNQTGATIPDGTPVYATGTLGASGRITVAPMIADGTIDAKYFLGVTTEDIADGGDGKITTFGKIRGLNTSAYTEGQTLWVSSTVAGAFQTTRPLAPNLDLEVAIVINSHVNNGTIFVRANNGHYLGTAHDVNISSVAENDLLVYKTNRWVNTKSIGDLSAANVTLSGYLRGPEVFVIDPAAHGNNQGLVQILGDLRVDGYTTTINSTTITVSDKNITLAKDAVTAGDANGAGITIAGANATLTYLSATDDFTFNKNVNASRFLGPLTGDVTGNADTADALSTARNIALTGSVTGNADFDGSGNITITTTTNHNHDDRYYTETESDAKYLLNTTDTLDGNLTVTGDLSVTGTIDLSNADLNIGAADIIFDTTSTGANRGLIWNVSPSGFLSKLVGGGADGGKVTLFANMDDAITTGNIFEIKDGSTGSLFLGLSHAGILTAGGGTSTQWNTAYNYSTVGHLPLAGGTLTGQLIVGSASAAASPTLRVNTPTSSTFVHIQESIAANLTTGQHVINVIGKETNTKNSGYIGYYWAANASDSNFVTIGHWGADDLFRVYGNGNVTISGTLSASGYNNTNWDTAYGWGNHASAGYIKTNGTTHLTSTKKWAIIKNTGTGTGDYSEFQISNNADNYLVMGSIGSNYTDAAWAGSSYVYSDRELRLKSNGEFKIYAGGYANSNIALTFDASRNASFTGSIYTPSTITANRFTGINSLVLNNYTTVNPASNVFLYSQPNDRDAWLFLDSADTGSNWGIYHRQIDSTVGDLPANSIGFVGGGSSVLQAYISLANGSAFFRGNTTTNGSFTASTGGVAVTASSSQNTGLIVDGGNNSGIIAEFKNSTTKAVINTSGGGYFLGDVGIGMTSPAMKLSVAGGILAAGSAGNNLYGVYVSPTNENTINSAYGTDDDTRDLWLNYRGYNDGFTRFRTVRIGNGKGIEFARFEGSTGNTYLSTSGGSVGIGTTSPSRKLDVVGDWKLGNIAGGYFGDYLYGTELNVAGLTTGGWARANKITTSDSSGTVFFGVFGDTTTLERAYWTIGNPASVDTTGYASSNGIILLRDGRVGIGTTNPVEKLDVNGVSRFINPNDPLSGAIVSKMLHYTPAPFGFVYRGYSSGAHSIQVQREYNDGEVFALSLQPNGGNVGIGTITPSQKLHVVGDTYLNGKVGIGITPTTTWDLRIKGDYPLQLANSSSSAKFEFYANLSENRYLNGAKIVGYNQDLSIDTNSSTYDIILASSGGKVGIGTTSPGYKLEIATDNFNTGMRIVQDAGTGYAPASIILEARQSPSRGSGLYHYNTQSDISWYSGTLYNNTGQWGIAVKTAETTWNPDVAQTTYTKFCVDSTGNVGIGTITPSQKLHVDGVIQAGPSSTAGGPMLYQAYSAPNYLGSFGAEYSSGAVLIGYGATGKNGASGYVSTFANFNGIRGLLRLANGEFSVLSSISAVQTAVGGDLSMTTNFIVTNGGSVGIGTTSPLRKLHVVGNFAVNAAGSEYYGVNITGGEGANPNILIGDWHNASANLTWDSTNRLLRIDSQYSTSGAPIVFSGNDAAIEYGRFSSTGNLGIGTTSPQDLLNIHNSSANANIGLKITRGTQTHGLRLGVNNSHAFLWTTEAQDLAFATNNIQRLTIQAGGDVGIGTTSPGAKLDVVGTTYVRNGDFYTDVIKPYQSDILTILGGGNNYIHINGRVGIGVSNPSKPLQVQKRSIAEPALMIGGAFSGGPRLQVYGLDADANAWMGLGTDMAGNPYEHSIYFSDYGGYGLLTFGTYNGTNYSQKMCIKRDGNVAIGTSTADYRFVVYQDGDVWHTKFGNDNGQVRIGGYTGSGAVIQSRTNSGTARALFLNRDGGNVAINANSASYPLDVTGTIRATGDVLAYSDARVKENIKTIDNALDKVMSMRGVSYNRTDNDDKTKKVGVIAQEIQKVLPEVVSEQEDGMLSVSYGNIVGVLIEAIKEQQKQIDELKSLLNGSTK